MLSTFAKYSRRVVFTRSFSTNVDKITFEAVLPQDDVDLLGKGVVQAKVKKEKEENVEPEYINPDIVIQEDGSRVNIKTGEVGGPKGPEPTRFGDFERAGRCYDF